MYKIIGADQKEYGPVSADDLRRWAAEGRVNAQTLIQAEGQTDWQPLSSFPELSTTSQQAPSIAPLSAAQPATNAAALVSGPATGLMIVGIFCALAAVLGLVSNVLGIGAGAMNQPGGAGMPPQLEQWVKMTSGGVGIALNVLGLAVSGLIIFASGRLRRLQSYGMVMAATIISMVPCLSPCCCVGLPVGVWILIVLMKPEVKSAFH